MTAINAALREHVTGTTFALTLRKTQIAALVWIDCMLAEPRTPHEQLAQTGTLARRPGGRIWGSFIPGVRGLIDRGLVEHILPDDRRNLRHGTFDLRSDQVWRITPAGRLVIGLLKEAGIWQEHFVPADLATPEEVRS